MESVGDVMADPTPDCILVVEKYFPKVSELCEILNYNPCPEFGCTEVFSNSPNLEMHLKKVHGKEDGKNHHVMKQKNVVRQYYCPAVGCKYMYNPDSFSRDFRYFSQHKYLKQHYIKVHMEKKFICQQCGKGFATAQQRKRHHLDECGLKFVCSCTAEYSSVSALYTHAARKKHKFIKSWSPLKNKKCDQPASVIGGTKKPIVLLPKPADTPLMTTPDISSGFTCPQLKMSVDKEIQTEPTHQRRKRNTLKTSDTSRQTQTGDKWLRISSETQTVGEYFIESKNKGKTGKINNRRRKNSMETQTCVNKNKGQESNHNNNNNIISLNPILDINSLSLNADISLPLWWNCETASTQTLANEIPTLSTVEPDTQTSEQNILNYFTSFSEESNFEFKGVKDVSLFSTHKENVSFDNGKSCSTETQTDCNLDVLLNNCSDTFSNIETQTTLDFLDQYSNMCTQTCDEIMFSGLGFSDIETQTAWSEFDISFADTETQTIPNPYLANNF